MYWMLQPLKRYADFSGRSRRKEYWMFTLFNVMVWAALVFAGYLTAQDDGYMSSWVEVAMVAYGLGTAIPSLAVTVRRFHDQNRSGWYVLLNMIPWVGSMIVTVMMCAEGTAGANAYGPDPKEVTPPPVTTF